MGSRSRCGAFIYRVYYVRRSFVEERGFCLLFIIICRHQRREAVQTQLFLCFALMPCRPISLRLSSLMEESKANKGRGTDTPNTDTEHAGAAGGEHTGTAVQSDAGRASDDSQPPQREDAGEEGVRVCGSVCDIYIYCIIYICVVYMFV